MRASMTRAHARRNRRHAKGDGCALRGRLGGSRRSGRRRATQRRRRRRRSCGRRAPARSARCLLGSGTAFASLTRRRTRRSHQMVRTSGRIESTCRQCTGMVRGSSGVGAAAGQGQQRGRGSSGAGAAAGQRPQRGRGSSARLMHILKHAVGTLTCDTVHDDLLEELDRRDKL